MNARSPLPIIATMAALTLCVDRASAQTVPASAPAPVLNPIPHSPSNISRELGMPGRMNNNRRTDLFYLLSTSKPMAATAQYARVQGFAKCAVNVSPALSARLLSMDPRSGQSAVVSRQLRGISRGCAPAGAYIPSAFFRGAVAESLYRRESSAVIDTNGDMRGKPASVETMPQCLFAQSPASVDALLRSSPGTEEERRAFSRLATFAPRCIMAGRRVSITALAPFIRAELAETAYRAIAPKALQPQT